MVNIPEQPPTTWTHCGSLSLLLCPRTKSTCLCQLQVFEKVKSTCLMVKSREIQHPKSSQVIPSHPKSSQVIPSHLKSLVVTTQSSSLPTIAGFMPTESEVAGFPSTMTIEDWSIDNGNDVFFHSYVTLSTRGEHWLTGPRGMSRNSSV